MDVFALLINELRFDRRTAFEGEKRQPRPFLRPSLRVAPVEANVNLALIKHALGHRSIASTAIYTQPTDETAESAHTLHILITDLSWSLRSHFIQQSINTLAQKAAANAPPSPGQYANISRSERR
jgi:hypothetical protein